MMTLKPVFNVRRVTTGVVAIFLGCLLNYAGDHLLGQRVELYFGLQTFNGIWFLEIFILPLLVGFVTAWIFGLGGKWLCYFPPLIVRFYAYYETVYILGVPSGASLMPMGWWGFFVILAIESAAIGGVAGEILNKRIYGRTPRELLYKSLDKSLSDDAK
ncbi:MAG: hypothetical protein OEW08_01325 [Gammaproteobacteria bacterium]|nr:hypothetical protein [Gammaproteobacteria bacterium]